MKTFLAKKENELRGWVIVDLKGQTVGRAATKIADILRGKHRPAFTPHVDTGDFVVAINAAHVKLTGKKWSDKIYRHHSHYMGGLKEITAEKLLLKHPEDLITRAVSGMLPKNKLRDDFLKKFKVYAEAEHPHKAQNPKEVQL